MGLGAGIITAIVALTLVSGVPSALADGDPASDVLTVQNLFLPADAAIPSAQRSELAALDTQANRHGVPLRVAIVASATDLGSVTALWRQPEPYARFLGEELSLIFRGELLVVMPNGYGLVEVGPAKNLGSASSALARLPGPSQHLGPATIAAVEKLASAAGHPLGPAHASPQATARGGGPPLEALLAFVIGCLAIAAAWTASLRARPLRARPTAPPVG